MTVVEDEKYCDPFPKSWFQMYNEERRKREDLETVYSELGIAFDDLKREKIQLESQMIETSLKLKLAGCVVEDWLSEHSGNYEWRQRFYHATGLTPPEWVEKWDDDYIEEKEHCFKRWLDRKREELSGGMLKDE